MSNQASRSPRVNFQLRDLLAVIALLCLLLALAVPMIQEAREAARNDQCRANLRTLSTAAISFESTFGNFPPGAVEFGDEPSQRFVPLLGRETEPPAEHSGPNWALSLTPYLDQASYDDLLECVLATYPVNVCDDCSKSQWQLGQAVPDHMTCPSASSKEYCQHTSNVTGLENLAKGNYAACYGSWKLSHSIYLGNVEFDDDADVGPRPHDSLGVMNVVHFRCRGNKMQWPEWRCCGPAMGQWQLGHRQGTSTRKIRDGLSKTMLLAEVVGTNVATDVRGVWTSGAMGAVAFTAYNPPNSGPSASIPHPIYATNIIEFGDKIIGCASKVEIRDKRLHCLPAQHNGDQWATARSAHSEGVNAVHADGSVRFYQDDIDIAVWQAIASRAGSDEVGQ